MASRNQVRQARPKVRGAARVGTRQRGLKQDLGRLRSGADGFIGSTFRGQSFEFRLLLAITLALVGIGLVMVLDASYVTDLSSGGNPFATFSRQLEIAIGGLLAMALISRASHDFFERVATPFTLGAVIVQGLTYFIGVNVNGNKSWIRIPVLGQIQPSEFLKIALILNLALLLEKQAPVLQEWGWKHNWLPAVRMTLIGMFFVGIGKDMGTLIIMAIILVVVISMAGLNWHYLKWVILAAILGGMLGIVSGPSRLARTIAWLNPNAPDPQDINWQAKHGIWALAAGGFTGVGFGKSTLKWSWIPEVDNDYIFAVIGEEFGLIGAAVVIGLFVALALTMFRILGRTRELWARLAIGGVMAWITFQAIVNISVVLSMLPVLGVPLPMISSGGSSLLANLMAIGVVLSIERHNSGMALPPRRSKGRRR